MPSDHAFGHAALLAWGRESYWTGFWTGFVYASLAAVLAAVLVLG